MLDLDKPHKIHLADEAATIGLGAEIAPRLRAGDVVYLHGELGMGKSTLARALIRALTAPDLDVPSPTFTLMQTYEAADFDIVHLDLYRLTAPEDSYELGLDDVVEQSVLLIEWPLRLGHLGFDDRLDIVLEDDGKGARRAHLQPRGNFR